MTVSSWPDQSNVYRIEEWLPYAKTTGLSFKYTRPSGAAGALQAVRCAAPPSLGYAPDNSCCMCLTDSLSERAASGGPHTAPGLILCIGKDTVRLQAPPCTLGEVDSPQFGAGSGKASASTDARHTLLCSSACKLIQGSYECWHRSSQACALICVHLHQIAACA